MPEPGGFDEYVTYRVSRGDVPPPKSTKPTLARETSPLGFAVGIVVLILAIFGYFIFR